jgi:hypothetical protein
MVDRILRIYNRASEAEREEGLAWYAVAHSTAIRLASRYSVSHEQAAGVIAAVSPMNPWDRNVSMAELILSENYNGRAVERGYLQWGLNKARMILHRGCSPWEALTSQKVRAFFECILYNGITDTVCVDRHALSIVMGGMCPPAEQGITPKQYGAISAAYVEAAARIGLPAAQVQAITWVAWRNREH